ncbi:hypothetical protein [Nonomuraea helvata]|uniref:Uncharacterized protein n=1 Tax=Nonomuraea helvata TaxID=37484 RepID=A0ABV5RZY5_9ACTN
MTVNLLRATACLAAASVIGMWFATARRQRPATRQQRNVFSRDHLIVVAAEAILLFGGLRVLAAWRRPQQANVAWVATAVGVHFIALAPVWMGWGIAVPGVLLTRLGAGGLVLASRAAVAWVPLLSGSAVRGGAADRCRRLRLARCDDWIA